MSDIQRLPGESLGEFARRRAAELGKPVPPIAAPAPQWDSDLIPALEPNAPSPERVAIDTLIGGIDIVEAYNRWARKGKCDPKGRTESILVSCPNPAHPDRNPSAWITLNKGDGGVGNCAICGGFDKYDIAAWAHGYDVPSYRTASFREVIYRMAEDLGYTVMVQGKDEWAEKKTASAPTPSAETVAEPASSTASITSANPASTPATAATAHDPDPVIDVDFPEPPETFDWRELPTLGELSFLHDWMELTSQSYEPDEFYLWLGLAALSMAVGNDVVLKDDPDVRANLLICLVGSTGTGKSIAIRRVEYLIREAFPFDNDTGGGVKMIASPGSGEAMIDNFNHLIDDPAGSDRKIPAPIKGFYRENELSTFVKKASRSGSTIREVIMDMFDSAYPVGVASRAAGMVTARDHYLSVVSSTQPDALGGLLTHADMASGFLNRWMYAYGKPKRRPAITTRRIDVDPLVEPLRSIRAWATRKRVVDWHDLAAKVAFEEFFDARIRPMVEVEENEQPMVARLPLLAKKLVLLFAINRKRTTIITDDVRSVEMMWDYILSSYGIVSDRVSVNDESDCADKIRMYLKSHPDGAYTIRDIRKNSGAKKYAKNGSLVVKAIATLIASGEIEEVPRPKNVAGQPGTKYRYVRDAEPSSDASNVIAFPPLGGMT